MKTLSKRTNKELIERASKYRNWASRNWVSYTFLKNIYLLFLFPLVYLLSLVNGYIGLFSLLLYFAIPLFVLLDSKRISVVEENPADFVRAERVERFFEIVSWILYPLALMIIVILANAGRIGIPTEIVPTVLTIAVFILLAWLGLLFGIEINTIESSKLMKLIRERIIPKPKQHFFQFYPSEILRSRARFVVLSHFLARNPDRKKIGRRFSLFSEGLKIYNNYLREDFGFVISEPKRISCLARLATYSKDNADCIKSGLKSLTELMKDEKREPFEIIKFLKEMLNEPASFKDICAAIDPDPKRMRKWFSIHSDSIVGIVGIILAIVAIVLPMVLHA